MFKGLVMDSIVHLRECILINASVIVSLALGAAYLKTAGKRADKRIRIFYICAVLASMAALCPVTNAILRMITGTYYDAPDMWIMVPLIPLGAVMCAALAGEIAAGFSADNESASVNAEVTGDALKGNETKSAVIVKAVIGTALITAAILVCGSLGKPCEQTSGRPENPDGYARYIAEMVYEKKLPGGGEQVVLAPDDMIAYLHTYSGNAVTLYGRDMWDGRLTKNRYGMYSPELISIHDDMLKAAGGDTSLSPDLCRRAFEQGATVVILPPGGYDEAALKAAGYETMIFTSWVDDERIIPAYVLVTEEPFYLSAHEGP